MGLKEDYNFFFDGTKVRRAVDIPTQLGPDDLDDKPQVHKKLQDYDHSLEVDRWKTIGGKGGKSGIEMDDLTSEDI